MLSDNGVFDDFFSEKKFYEPYKYQSIFHRVATTNNTGQNRSLMIYQVYNKGIKAELVPGCHHGWIFFTIGGHI